MAIWMRAPSVLRILGAMTAERYGANAINVGGKRLLLTETSGGAVVHLTAAVGLTETGRGAVPDHYFDPEGMGTAALWDNYDKAALLDPHWAETTMCGRPWVSMASGDGGLLHEFDVEPALAPTCKRCLALMDKLFPAPRPDDRLALVTQVVMDLLVEHGYAEIQSVPGDQQATLRAAIRKAVLSRTGHGTRTYVHQSMIVFVCDALYEQHADRHEREAREAMNAVLDPAMTGTEIKPIRSPEWRTSWDAWAVD
jgi:hypothetical protein